MTLAHPTLFATYANALRIHVHQLIAEGYARMDKGAFADEQEPAITGELVREMRAWQESENGVPEWAACYSIHDDPPLSVDGKLGKNRPRVDIEFERMANGPRPRLRFEAKRLSSPTGHTVAGYLGNDGLGCFLSGKYPMTHGEAGMLGYVQSEDELKWAERIATTLQRDGRKFAVIPPPIARQHLSKSLVHTYVSHHDGPHKGRPVMIHHILLNFVGSGAR